MLLKRNDVETVCLLSKGDVKSQKLRVETYSGYDLNKCGVYKYVEHPDFDILLFGYAVNGGDVQVVDLASGEEIPEDVLSALSDESVTKWAFNASFERVCLSMWLRRNHPGYFYSYSIEEDSVKNYLDALSMLYGNVPAVLSELIRTAFVPAAGRKFIVSDFSAIEARVLSWLAGEQWRTDVFVNNGDIYCASASAMFGVPVEKHGQNAELRQKGKIAELALGYGGSVGALKSMGAIEMGLAEEELQPLVDS